MADAHSAALRRGEHPLHGQQGRPAAFAILKQWPGRRLVLKAIRAVPGSPIAMLGVREPLAWHQDGRGLAIAIPDNLQDEKSRPCEHAWVLKIARGKKPPVQ